VPVVTLGDGGEGWGVGSSVGDMVKARRMGWEEYRQGGRVKKAREIVHAAASCIPWLNQLMTAKDHTIPLADSVKMKSMDSYPNMPYTVKV
jgi:hypothetical protein